ncbi:MAG: hypothetical protein GX846_06135 [Deltaproteobacteria bacterium]|jgi:hypothetical protein|nr:hypothetical protein [Deltaproteobacteria bacterium]
MKNIIKYAALLLVIASLFLQSCSTANDNKVAEKNTQETAIKEPVKITVMNPAIANPFVDRVALTERLDTLDGKTLYLVDINWGGPDAAYGVFEEMEIWFNENMPKVNVVVKRKAGSYMADDPALWKEIGEKGHAALIGVSG